MQTISSLGGHKLYLTSYHYPSNTKKQYPQPSHFYTFMI